MAKILIYSFTEIGTKMAGPSIRCWEFAKSLSRNHEVTLMAPNQTDLHPDGFQVVQRKYGYRKSFKNFDFIISMQITHGMAWTAKKHGVKLILDAYDPLPLETLEAYKPSPFKQRCASQEKVVNVCNFSFQMADAIICASEIQRNLWTGLMLSLNKITPAIYDKDHSLERLIGIVPFGLPSSPPKRTGPGLRSKFNIKESDKVLIWGGGIWNWFDPLTLIEAMHLIKKHRSDVYLVFMGIKSPTSYKDDMFTMANRSIQLAKDLDLFNKQVLFNQDWIPYEDRVNFLLDADIGVSTHFDHTETKYSFRTRILDYIWAGLPFITTEGDSFAALAKEKQIGIAVPYQDAKALAAAILSLLDYPELAEKMKKNLGEARQSFYWDTVLQPLEKMLECSGRERMLLSDRKKILTSFFKIHGPLFPFLYTLDRMKQKLGVA